MPSNNNNNVITVAVSNEECTGAVTAGLLNRDSKNVPQGYTYILAGYTVPCNGTVVAWEFCYQISGAGLVTFYPGIWRITGISGNSGNSDYELVQSSTITYLASINTGGIDHEKSCKRVNLSTTDQFTAPAGSVVGLYSGLGTQLLHINTSNSTTTYQISGNQSSVKNANKNDNVTYNIAIRVHLGKYSEIFYLPKQYVCIHAGMCLNMYV